MTGLSVAMTTSDTCDWREQATSVRSASAIMLGDCFNVVRMWGANHMRKVAASVSALSLIFIGTGASEGSDQPWKAKLAPIVRSAKLSSGTYGLEFRRLRDGQVLYSDGAETLLSPASSIKVLIAATALSKFGPDHRFYTTLLRSGQDYCLKGGGDPSLVSETLWLMAQEARRRGAADIPAKLIADDSLFPALRTADGDFQGDEYRAFTAPYGALSLNYNSLTIIAEPTQVGKPAKVHLEPELPLFALSASVKTVTKAGKPDLGAEITTDGGRMRVRVFGLVGAETGEQAIYRSVPSPALYAGNLFAEQVRQFGGTVKGPILAGTCPNEAKEVFQFESKPLSQIIWGMNKFSNNFIAEMLLRAVGTSPTVESGLEAVHAWLAEEKIDTKGLVLENASGLSRKTRISPRTLTSILAKASSNLRYGPEFLSSLGIAGVDGTLHRRMKNSAAEGVIRAKSGRLMGVASMTGLFATPEDGNIAFAMIFNLGPAKENEAQNLEDRILKAIVAPNPH